ncbi:MAG: DNA-processing protein DprA [Desulfobulbaceae bacterium]|nr:DNA-processing protein DprA [Desulfobulbaceae bacterium]
MDNDGLKGWLTLSAIPGLGPALIHRLVKRFGSPAGVFEGREKDFAEIKGIGRAMARRLSDRIVVKNIVEAVERQLEYCDRNNIHLLCYEDNDYPSLLREIYDPPAVLYVRGDMGCLNSPSVAIVGSRAATSYGKRTSFQIAENLSGRGVTVVSGLALGVDSEAHKGALQGGGATVGVLGCGIDVVYPRPNKKLFEKVANGGVVISEYGPGVQPEGFRFPARNRIISGLSLGVVVVEAALRSGSLITARMALEQGREVFAVPGRVDSVKSAGTHHLIREGAVLIHQAGEILDELGIVGMIEQSSKESKVPLTEMCSESEKQLLCSLETYPKSIDEIIGYSGLTPAEIHDILLRLELRGLVRHLPGQQYEKV